MLFGYVNLTKKSDLIGSFMIYSFIQFFKFGSGLLFLPTLLAYYCMCCNVQSVVRRQSVHTAVECFVMRRRTCANTCGSMKASSHSNASCVSMHAGRAATLLHTCCDIRPTSHSCATVAAKHTSQEPPCDGTNAAMSVDAFSSVTGMQS